MSWDWRPATLSAPPTSGAPAAATVAATVAAGLVYVCASRPDGDAVSQLVIAPDGTVRTLPDLPLRSVSGAAAGPGGPVVAGARGGGQVPTLCAVDVSTGMATAVELPRPAVAPVAAWPVPVDGTPAGVVWATGREPATVRVGTLHPDRVTVRPIALTTRTIWSLQAVAAGDAIDLLAVTPDGGAYARIGADGRDSTRRHPSFSAAAVLCPGAILTPVGGHRVSVWDLPAGSGHELRLPAAAGPPGDTEVSDVRLVSDVDGPVPDLLVWTTRTTGTMPAGAGRRMGRAVRSRGWLAPIDRPAWRIGTPNELPISSPTLFALGGTLILVGTSTSATAWIGTPRAC